MNRFSYSLAFFLFVILAVNSQDLSTNNNLIVNEIGFVKGTQQSFLELILVNGSEGISGWTIDNFGNETNSDLGKIGFGANFPNLPVGTPILIYNNQDIPSGINPNHDHQMSPDGFYQIPFNSDYLQKVNNQSSSLADQNVNWEDILSMDNSENGIELRDASGATRSSYTWGYTGVETDPYFLGASTIGGVDPNTRALVYTGDCSTGGTNGSGGQIDLTERSLGTPGRFNTWENQVSIETIQTGNVSVLYFDIACSQQHPDYGPSVYGKVRIDFLRGIGPYSVDFTGPPETPPNASVNATNATINHAWAGEYSITVTDSRGCIRRCTVRVASQIEETEICEGEDAIVGRNITGEECGFKWEPQTGLLNPESSLTVASPEETTTYQLIISDGEGGIQSIEEYKVTVNEGPEVHISPNPALLCQQDVELKSSGEWASYNWEIPYPTTQSWDQPSVLALFEDAQYWPDIEPKFRLTVTDENGCTDEDEVIVLNENSSEDVLEYLLSQGFITYPITISEYSFSGSGDSRQNNTDNLVNLSNASFSVDDISGGEIQLLNLLQNEINADFLSIGLEIKTQVRIVDGNDICENGGNLGLDEFLSEEGYDYLSLIYIHDSENSDDDLMVMKIINRVFDNIDQQEIIIQENSVDCEGGDEINLECCNYTTTGSSDIIAVGDVIELNDIYYGTNCDPNTGIQSDIGNSVTFIYDGFSQVDLEYNTNPDFSFNNISTFSLFVKSLNSTSTLANEYKNGLVLPHLPFSASSEYATTLYDYFVSGQGHSNGQELDNPLNCDSDFSTYINGITETEGRIDLIVERIQNYFLQNLSLYSITQEDFFVEGVAIRPMFRFTQALLDGDVSIPSAAILGGTQQFRVDFINIEQSACTETINQIEYKIEGIITIGDVMGVSESDAIDFPNWILPGVQEQYILQSSRNNNGFCGEPICFVPFVHRVPIYFNTGWFSTE